MPESHLVEIDINALAMRFHSVEQTICQTESNQRGTPWDGILVLLTANANVETKRGATPNVVPLEPGVWAVGNVVPLEPGVCIGIRQVSGIFGHSDRPGRTTIPATINHLS